ncbi:MAG: 2-amino-4-hydroxy-6-hydroxymethyldihydropteridine diphosphokinase [Planctomycetaceae bacterium]|nr:2-amino-4-hydroxy-6-hydroxymethyldihydropteridine diphosphokinase [Planctomycetaceae bacterium]
MEHQSDVPSVETTKSGLIALGGNLGQSEELLQDAIRSLNSHPRLSVQQCSSFYSTVPIGSNAGDRYINAACVFSTTLPPQGVLEACQAVENQLGRTREIHWGPRTVDLDLITYAGQIISTAVLKVPHPACWYRRFVLDPVCEIATEVVHPQFQLTFGELRNRILQRPLSISYATLEKTRQERIQERIRAHFSSGQVQVLNGNISATESAVIQLLTGELPPDHLTPGSLYESTLPRPFEDAILDVLRAALDEPEVNH